MTAEISQRKLSRKDLVVPISKTHHRKLEETRPAGVEGLLKTAFNREVKLPVLNTQPDNLLDPSVLPEGVYLGPRVSELDEIGMIPREIFDSTVESLGKDAGLGRWLDNQTHRNILQTPLNLNRRLNDETDDTFEEVIPDPKSTFEEAAESDVYAASIIEVLKKSIDPLERKVLEMHAEGESLRSIGESVGQPRDKAKTILQRAKKKAAAALQEAKLVDL